MTTTAVPTAVRTAPPARGDALAGTGTLIRFNLRRDRVRTAVWLLALTLGSMATLGSFTTNYPAAGDRDTLVATLDSPAGLALTGPRHYLTDYNYGAMMGHQMIGFMAIMVGIMSVLTVVRHTRAEEESGRAELVRAAVVGRHAHLTAALTVAVLSNAALALLLTIGMGSVDAEGITQGGSLLYGITHAVVGIVFAAAAAVAVQITGYSRGASGMGLAVIGLAYLLRAAGDSVDSAASWLSPIGWAQATHVYVDDRWWPLLLVVALAVGLAAAGFALSTRRDVGAGLRSARPGRREASDLLARPLGFAVRLHRGLLIGFAVAIALLGLSYGSVLGDVERMLANVEALQDPLARVGGETIVDSFVAMIMVVTSVVAAVYVVLAVLRSRAEETAGRAEPVLATGLSRSGWLASHVTVALAGGTAVQLLGGLTLAASGAPATGDTGLFGTVMAGALAYVPALWVTAGVAVALFGWLPRAGALAWLVVVYAGVVGYLGQILRFPEWMNSLSPFGHVPRVPVEEFSWARFVLLAAVAAGLIAFGMSGFRRRDLETK